MSFGNRYGSGRRRPDRALEILSALFQGVQGYAQGRQQGQLYKDQRRENEDQRAYRQQQARMVQERQSWAAQDHAYQEQQRALAPQLDELETLSKTYGDEAQPVIAAQRRALFTRAQPSATPPASVRGYLERPAAAPAPLPAPQSVPGLEKFPTKRAEGLADKQADFNREQKAAQSKAFRDAIAAQQKALTEARTKAYTDAYGKALEATGDQSRAHQEGLAAAQGVQGLGGGPGAGGLGDGGGGLAGLLGGNQPGAGGTGASSVPDQGARFLQMLSTLQPRPPAPQPELPGNAPLADVLGAYGGAGSISPASYSPAARQPAPPPSGANVADVLRFLVQQGNPAAGGGSPRLAAGRMPAGGGAGAGGLTPFRTPQMAQVDASTTAADLNRERIKDLQTQRPYVGRKAEADVRRVEAQAHREELYPQIKAAELAQADRRLDATARTNATRLGIEAMRARNDTARQELERVKVERTLPQAVKLRADALVKQMEVKYRASVAYSGANPPQTGKAEKALGEYQAAVTELDGLLDRNGSPSSPQTAIQSEFAAFKATIGRDPNPKEKEAIANRWRARNKGR